MIAKQDSKSRCFLMRLLILKFGSKNLNKVWENWIHFRLLVKKAEKLVKWEFLWRKWKETF